MMFELARARLEELTAVPLERDGSTTKTTAGDGAK
jgi:hypothetical protein